MKSNRFVGWISSIIWETFKFNFLSIISLGFATPWLLRKYLDFIYSNIILESGHKLTYKDDKPSDLLVTSLVYILLSILTLGIFSIAYVGEIVSYISCHTIVEKDNEAYTKCDPGSAKDHFKFGIWVIPYSFLYVFSFGFAAPFIALKMAKRASEFFVFKYNDGKQVKSISIVFDYKRDETKNMFIKEFFINNVLLLSTFGLYCGYYNHFIYNGLLQFVSVQEHNK